MVSAVEREDRELDVDEEDGSGLSLASE